jgi:hypothetical protein
LIAERYPSYAEADLTVETGDESPDRTVLKVLSALAGHAGSPPAGSDAE